MSVLIICAIIAGIATLYVSAPLMRTKPQTCYILMFFIPAVSLTTFMVFMPSAPQYAPSAPVIDVYEQEEIALKKKLDQYPNDATTVLDLAGTYIAQEKYSDAIALLRDAQRKDPRNDDFALQLATAHFARGLLYAENGNYELGLKSLLYAVAEAPENAPFLPDIEHFIGELEKKIEESAETANEGNLTQD